MIGVRDGLFVDQMARLQHLRLGMDVVATRKDTKGAIQRSSIFSANKSAWGAEACFPRKVARSAEFEVELKLIKESRINDASDLMKQVRDSGNRR